MDTHRVVHDFRDLTHEDVVDVSLDGPPDSTVKRKIRAAPYQFLFAALAFGLLLGYLAKRN